MVFAPVVEASIISEVRHGPFSRRVSQSETSRFPGPPNVVLPDFTYSNEGSKYPIEALLKFDEGALRDFLGGFGQFQPLSCTLLLIERVLRLRFNGNGGDKGLIVDLSGGIVTGEDIEGLVQLIGPNCMRAAAYLDLSHSRPRNESLICAEQLQCVSAHLPNLRCINLIGSNCVTRRSMDQFYSWTAPTGTISPHHKDSSYLRTTSPVALIYEPHFRLLPMRAFSPPKFSIFIRSNFRSTLVPRYFGASWPFFQLDSALEAVAKVASRSRVEKETWPRHYQKMKPIIESAMGSLGPSRSSPEESIAILPPAVVQGSDVKHALKGCIFFLDISHYRPRGLQVKSYAWITINPGEEASVEQMGSSNASLKTQSPSIPPFQSYTLQSFVDAMLPHVPEAHRPSATLLKNVKSVLNPVSQLCDECLGEIIKKISLLTDDNGKL